MLNKKKSKTKDVKSRTFAGIKYILPLLVVSALFTACGPTTNDAVLFNDQIVAAQKSCIQGEKDFYKTCGRLNPEEIKASYEMFGKRIDSSLKLLQEVKEEKEFGTFKENAVKLVGTYKSMIPNEYKEYAAIYSLPNDQYTVKDSIRCAEVADKINTALNPLVKSFISEQEVFAAKWNFKLKAN